jgi:hypothetical protein
VISRAISRRAAGRRRAGLLALVAIFWLAQLQGVSHLVSHLGRDHAAPHSLVCGDCIASADAGAAPLSAVCAPALAAPAESAAPLPARALITDRRTTAYRSRAPPATSI